MKVTTGGVGIKATPTDGDLIVGQCEYAPPQATSPQSDWRNVRQGV